MRTTGLKNKGLTIIEILVVTAIIFLLASASLPAYRKVRLRALIVKTNTLILSLESAISMYASDFGDYPRLSGTGTKDLVILLQGPVESVLWNGPYMRFKEADLDEDGNIVDAWGTPVYYQYPQNLKNNVPYLIISAGSDRKWYSESDLGNW